MKRFYLRLFQFVMIAVPLTFALCSLHGCNESIEYEGTLPPPDYDHLVQPEDNAVRGDFYFDIIEKDKNDTANRR